MFLTGEYWVSEKRSFLWWCLQHMLWLLCCGPSRGKPWRAQRCGPGDGIALCSFVPLLPLLDSLAVECISVCRVLVLGEKFEQRRVEDGGREDGARCVCSGRGVGWGDKSLVY